MENSPFNPPLGNEYTCWESSPESEEQNHPETCMEWDDTDIAEALEHSSLFLDAPSYGYRLPPGLALPSAFCRFGFQVENRMQPVIHLEYISAPTFFVPSPSLFSTQIASPHMPSPSHSHTYTVHSSIYPLGPDRKPPAYIPSTGTAQDMT